ncbi:MAG: type II toxin-antitoxin system RelE/ParE family toxin [Planctomycetia bacterium]|nr:type II toxin-antitoxin system RelE/ParE family toxin [Planctomycetia bacterium]
MAQVAWTEEAERWRRDIFDYIAEDDETAASKAVQGIVAREALLGRVPELGYWYDQRDDRNVRIVLCGHYRIAYAVKPDGNIDVVGVFHASLDIERYML